MNKIFKDGISSKIFSIIVIFFLLSPTKILCQNCYKWFYDAAGASPSQGQINSLNSASCILVDSFPLDFRDSFKVFDFGFYVHHETMQGGYPKAFETAINKIEDESKYYLAFGKQTDQSGIYTKIWVSLKLPSSGQFSCMSELQREIYNSRIEISVSNKYESLKKSPSLYHDAEIEGISELIKIINEIKECCLVGAKNKRLSSCDNCSSELIEKYFEYNNYTKVQALINPSSSNNINNNAVRDISEAVLSGNCVGATLQSISNLINTYVPFHVLVTSDNNFCTYTPSEIQALRSNSGFDCHINLSTNIENYSNSNFRIEIRGYSNEYSEDKIRNIEFTLYCVINKKLNTPGITFNSNDPLETIVDIFFKGLELTPPDPTPENISTNYYLYQKSIDMDNAPESSPKNALGVKRNAEFFFKEKLRIDPHLWSNENKQLINANEPPVVDAKWIQYNPTHADFEFKVDANGNYKYDQNGNKIRQPLRHHHHEHGKYAYALPEGLHQKYSKYLHFLARESKNFTKDQKIEAIRAKINRLNRGLGQCNLFLNVYSMIGGLFTDDPGNIINWFGPVQIGKLKYKADSDNYILFYQESHWGCNQWQLRTGTHATWEKCAQFIVYSYYAYDETEGKWVGLGPLATGYAIKHCNGEVDIIIQECWASDCPPNSKA